MLTFLNILKIIIIGSFKFFGMVFLIFLPPMLIAIILLKYDDYKNSPKHIIYKCYPAHIKSELSYKNTIKLETAQQLIDFITLNPKKYNYDSLIHNFHISYNSNHIHNQIILSTPKEFYKFYQWTESQKTNEKEIEKLEIADAQSKALLEFLRQQEVEIASLRAKSQSEITEAANQIKEITLRL